jgi:fluoride exporter
VTHVEPPVDSDVDLRVPAQRRELLRGQGSVLGVIAIGGGLGSLARWGMALVLPTEPGAFPWHTFVVNVAGCVLIGVLMVLVTEVHTAHRLVRPFLGVGVLGGFTTFSTYAVEIHDRLRPGTAGVAVLYLFGTLLAAMAGVAAGTWATRAATREAR